ncbi:MAG: nucleotide exchange factor GrpE [Patescibacteria group bacterium]|jgi:molecular chaperone GrpE
MDEDKKVKEDLDDQVQAEETQDDGVGAAEVDLVLDYKNKWLRAVADYQNLKKDTIKEKEDWIKFANAGLVLELIPILNNFKEATKHIPVDQQKLDWVVGIFHIKKQLEDVLKNIGIEDMKTVGEKFNPEFHEAVSQREEKGVDPDQVIEEVRPGYTMHGKVIEAAKVVVSK